jgi:hypothetical protein
MDHMLAVIGNEFHSDTSCGSFATRFRRKAAD